MEHQSWNRGNVEQILWRMDRKGRRLCLQGHSPFQVKFSHQSCVIRFGIKDFPSVVSCTGIRAPSCDSWTRLQTQNSESVMNSTITQPFLLLKYQVRSVNRTVGL